MKKAAILILTILYLGSATGASVNIHYCMGEFSGWELGHDEGGPCDSCGMEKGASADSDCCRDEHKSIKVSDVHKSAQVYIDLLQVQPIEAEDHNIHIPSVISSITERYPLINAPPGAVSESCYLLYRSIRI